MPKAIDTPEQLTGKDKVELAAEPSSELIEKMIKGAVKEGLGEVKAEMLEESRAKAHEAAQAVVADAPAPEPCDPANVYGRDFVAMFQRMAQGQATQELHEESAFTTLSKAAVYLHKAGGNAHIANDLMLKDKISGKSLEIAQKALGIHDFTAGGALLQGDMYPEVIPELLSETALFNDGAIPSVPVNGQLTVPYENSGPTTRNVEENAAANASEPAFEQMMLSPKDHVIVVPASRKFLSSVAAGAQHVERSMRRSLAVDVDYDMLRGAGVSSKMTGLRYLANSSNLLNATTTVSAATSMIDLVRLQEAVQNSNVSWAAPEGRYAISPRTWRYLMTLDSGHNFPFQQEMVTQQSLLGVKLAGQSGRGVSAIPENLSVTDSSETEIYFYTVGGLLVALGENVRLEMSDSAAYNNSSGTVVSAFSRDQVVWKLVLSMDLGSIYRGHNIACLIDCDWGV